MNSLQILFMLFGALFLTNVTCQTDSTAMSGLHVKGNRIVNSADKEVRLRGANRPGTEYSCVQYGKIFDGPVDQASIDSMRSWKMNAVRVPINEDCWSGTDGVDPALGGSTYQNAIIDYVSLLTRNGLAVIVDLHWASNGTSATAHKQIPMPARATAPALWVSLANAFKSNSAVLFDIYNEPFPDGNAWDSSDAWSCWKSGGYCADIGYETAGMDELVEAVRSTGSTNIVLISGIQYATSLVRFLEFMPNDNNLAAAVHIYDFNFCRSRGCWDIYWRPVYEKIPLVAAEMGQTDCDTDFIYDVMNYADANGIGFLAWAWLPADCAKDPSIIRDFNGTASNYGIGLQTHLNNLAAGIPTPFYYTFSIFADRRTHWVDNWTPLDALIYFNETKTVHSGSYSIKFSAVPNKPLHYMCWGCFNTTYVRGVNIWVNGGGNSNQKIYVNMMQMSDLDNVAKQTAYNQAVEPGVDLASLIDGGIPANTWKLAYLNLSRFPAGSYDGISFNADSNQTWIYLDDIKALAVNDDGTEKVIIPNTSATGSNSASTSTGAVNSAHYLLPSCLLAALSLLVSVAL
eukprot:TRINITY_DN1657_c0_g1_i1.p1 TRINITY_DN1657_c0_g1~~TRINITY_DN1657_c0_g1_i1.p1  ORF type:complete len:572 (-),score=150.53 TRINITY_DN1657_c0_g1_i1:95-1810(-)